MKTTVITGFAMLAFGALSVAACTSPAPQESAPVSPAAIEQPVPTTGTSEVSINAVMVALVDHAGHQLWNVEVEGKAPKTDAAWAVVEEHAIQIVAAGAAITVAGSGPNDAGWVGTPSWHTYAKQMSNAGVAAMNAAKNKDLPALVTANGQLVQSCVSCHKEFKPDLPTEGILHSHHD